jgi:hypothetical protein
MEEVGMPKTAVKIRIDGLAAAILEALKTINRLEARWAIGG